ENLQIAFQNYTFTTVYQSTVWLASSMQETSATAIYTNENLENTITVNDTLAWRLFGTAENIEGLTVHIGEVQYIVTAVRSDGGDYTAWLPREDNMPISAIYLHPYPPDPLAQATANTMLEHIGRNPENYAIIDISRFVESINIRSRIFLYVILLAAMIYFLQMAQRRTQKRLPILGAVLCLAAFVWGANDILLWLPNLSALNHSLFNTIIGTGILPPDTYLSSGLLRISQLSRMSNYALIVGAVAFVGIIPIQKYQRCFDEEQ
ncbi:MAG: hypothetical protein FWB80_04820, partial [Defluviitaleaceae bacterium]|nr:hypothetical protein [Defluviitaleaceae bacterium]